MQDDIAMSLLLALYEASRVLWASPDADIPAKRVRVVVPAK